MIKKMVQVSLIDYRDTKEDLGFSMAFEIAGNNDKEIGDKVLSEMKTLSFTIQDKDLLKKIYKSLNFLCVEEICVRNDEWMFMSSIHELDVDNKEFLIIKYL